MGQVSTVTHKGASIVKVDLSHTSSVEENLETLEQAKKLIRDQPPGSVLLLTDVTKAFFNAKGISAIKDWSSFNTPYVKASAVLGVSGIYRIVYEAVVKLVGREIACFDSEEQALDWLAAR